MQTTLILIKPDAVQRGLVGEIISRFERKGLQLVGTKLVAVSEDLASEHYAEHKDKPFFPDLIGFITSTPVVALALHGRDAIAVCRKLVGATDGTQADPGTIRGDFGLSKSLNMVHASDSPESAERELKLWFTDAERVDYDRSSQAWITG
ncbi:MAG: nucleoside-diphosphate kinase [Phycisphaeraceae bacterium]